MEKISWTDRMKSEVLPRVKKDRKIRHTIERKKANWIGHVLRRNCFLQRVIEGKVKGKTEVTRVRGGRCKQLKKRGGYRKLKEEELDLTVWGTGFGIICGLVERQTRDNDDYDYDDDDDDEDDLGWSGIFTTRAGQIPGENFTVLFLGWPG